MSKQISRREDPKRLQIAVLQPESEEAFAIPAVADFNDTTTQPGTEIRSVESPEPKPLAPISNQLLISSKSSPVTAIKGRVQTWRLDIQDSSSETRSDGIRSLSASIFAEEDLQDRVSWMFGKDSSFSQALICNLKDKLNFILPLFNVDEDQDLFESPFVTTPLAYERGPSQGTSSNSTVSSNSKSSNATDVSKEEKSTEDKDKSSKIPQLSIKRRISSNSQASSGRERRRLRCHFHAKCPASHSKRTCTQSSWLSIHNLKGHNDAHLLLYDATDALRNLRRSLKSISISEAKLDDERDEELTTLVMKYKLEQNNNTKDDAHDSRELGKWYKHCGILYPNHQGVVPTPFQISSASPGDLKIERWLEVFDSIMETKLGENQLPPSEPHRQIDYYKDVIRDIYNLIQPNSSLRTIPSPQLRNAPDIRFLHTTADSSTQAFPNPKCLPEVKRNNTVSQEASIENNDQDLASQNSRSSGSQPPVDCSPQPNMVAEVVSTEQQSSAKPVVTTELKIATSTSEYTSLTGLKQNSSEPNFSEAHTDQSGSSEVTITPPHRKED
ncbi:hypothetical protein N431DRAFT_462011 [Stipitochalara longipes BDJ]|nr:hypothetical protein N431DRAFT_462011 [Stipitochalara longipes BDJ]